MHGPAMDSDKMILARYPVGHMPTRTPITDDLRQKLINEKRRTGVGQTTLLRGSSRNPDHPQGLTSNLITGWLAGTIKSAKPTYLEYVLACWADLPDAVNRNPRIQKNRVPITEATAQLLEQAWEDGLLPDAVKGNRQCPDGLTIGMIRTWKDGRIRSAEKDYLEFVIEIISNKSTS